MNQAVIMAENDFGDKKEWYKDTSGTEVDEDGNPIEGTSNSLAWYNKYLAKYIESTKIVVDNRGVPTIYLKDGSAFEPASHNTRDWIFYPNSVEKCKKIFQAIGKASVHSFLTLALK